VIKRAAPGERLLAYIKKNLADKDPAWRNVRLEDLPLYDTLRVDVGGLPAQTRQFFVNPIGAAADGFAPKTGYATNLTTAGQVPSGRGFELHQLATFFRATSPTPDPTSDISNFQNAFINSFLTFESLDYKRVLGPPDFYPAGGGGSISGIGGGGGGNTGFVRNGSDAWMLGTYHFVEPLIIIPGQQFRVEWAFGNFLGGTLVFDVGIRMQGLAANQINPN